METNLFVFNKSLNLTNLEEWNISSNALSGKNGIYTHVSYREDKSDMHPQAELIAMLQSLSQ